MAKSQFEYVKKFELADELLPNCWILVRLDGRSFSRFTREHGYEKPNDRRGVELMNQCALRCCKEFQDVCFATGQSDEFSFVLSRASNLWNRRASKLQSYFASYFSSCFVFHWKEFFGELPLSYPPMFDCRAVCYPAMENIRDYLSWRQADCHINNLYNTAFWALVSKAGQSEREANETLRGTNSAQKNEILFERFSINYNDEPEVYRKGSILYQKRVESSAAMTTAASSLESGKQPRGKSKKKEWVVEHVDIIGEQFWKENPGILS